MTPTDEAIVARFRRDGEQLGVAIDRQAAGPVALAVSGGPDSMAMLALAAAAWPGRVIAATFDHRLRAENADEAKMVGDACAALSLPHATLVADAPIAGSSLQAQAREARYAALTIWASGANATALLTAHHADDQAETFLMRAARGSGLAGLAGIRARQPLHGVLVLRPLLAWRRAELRAIVRRAGLPFVDDPSNQDLRHDRSRFRRLLESNEWLDPPHLAAAAAYLAEAERDLSAITDWLAAERSVARTGSVTVDMAGLPRELRRRLARRAIEAVRTDTACGESDWHPGRNVEPLLDALEGGRRATLAGVVAQPDGELWRFRVAPPRRAR